jgi:LPS export ABC transporter permease LptG
MRWAAGWPKSLAEAAAALPGGAARSRRPGVLDLYLIRGVAGPFLVVLVAACVAMMLERALRLIHQLAASGADISYFFLLLAQLAPYYLDLAIPAAFMVALVILVTRLDERLELEAMLASGLSLSRIAAPLVAFGIVVAGLGLVAGGWLEPVGRYNFRSLQIEALNAGRIGRLQPRALYHPADTLAVTFDRRSADGGVEGIFVWQRLADGRELVLTGGSGRIGFSPRGRLFGIDLDSGRHVVERPGAAAHLVEFDNLAFRESLRLEDSRWARGWDQKELTLAELIAEARSSTRAIPRHAVEAEYLNRLARAATIPLIPLIVLPLAVATKRGRRGLGILLCGAFLAVAHHAMNMVKGLALSGAADPALSILGTAGLIAALTLLLFVSGRHLPSHSPIHSVLKPLARPLARLAPRARTLPSLRGRTVATYIGWQLAKWTMLALLAIVALLQMVDLFDRSEAFVARGMGSGDAAFYAWLRLPAQLQLALPIAALAGAMATFAGLGRSREMTAIRGAGISQWRILLMAAPVPLLLSLAVFFLAERATPRSQQEFAAWWAATEPAAEAEPPQARWFRIGDEIVRAGSASADGARLGDVRIFRRDSSGRLNERLAGAAAAHVPGGWSLTDAAVTRFASGEVEQARTARLTWRTPLRPADVQAFFSSPSTLSSTAARRSLEALAPVSQAEALFATRIHRSAAEPLAPLLMLLLALPLAFLSPRTSTAWPAWLYAAGGGLLYLVADGVLTVAGQVGYLPAAVGAWAAPVTFALTGITVLLYSER